MLRSTELQNSLNFYADAGYIITPLSARGPKNPDGLTPILAAPGKIPKLNNWRTTEYNPFPDAKQFEHNFGIVLQADDLIIDVDPRNFDPGIDSFQLFAQSCPPLADIAATLTVQTGGGGLHIYLKKPRDWAIKGILKAFHGIEFKTAGQQIVGAGSIHPETGNIYKIISVKMEVLNAPVFLLEMIKKSAVDVERKEGSDEYLDDASTIKRFNDYLESAPPAIEGQNGDLATFAVAAKGRDFGLSPEAVLRSIFEVYNPRCVPEWTPQDLRTKVDNAYRYASNMVGCASPEVVFKDVTGTPISSFQPDTTLSGDIAKTQKNTVFLFTQEKSPLLGLLAFNEFSQDIVFTRTPPWRSITRKYVWTDEEALMCKNWMANEMRYEAPTPMLHEAAVVVSQFNSFHPVKFYLDGLKWDKCKRIHNWMNVYLGTEDNEYTRAIGLKILLAGVARIYDPGCKFDYIPVLEGKQGTGKSQALSILGGEWFSDQRLDISSKDTIDAMRGKWIIEMSEMECQRKADTQTMRAFLSRPTDRARLAYMRCSKDYPRQCIFIGTINPEQDQDLGYLHDTTGNRRFWPVATNEIRLDALRSVRSQLWAEAVHLYKQGIPLYLDQQPIEALATVEQRKRMGRDPWTDKIINWLQNDVVYKDRQVVTSTEIFTECIQGKATAFGRREMARILQVMLEVKWEHGAFYHQQFKQVTKGYRRPGIE